MSGQDREVRFAPGLTGIEHAEREVSIFQPPRRRQTIYDDPGSFACLGEGYANRDKQQGEQANPAA